MKVIQFIPLAGFAIAILMMPFSLASAPEAKVFESKADGFKITLPGGWEEISSEILNSFGSNTSKLAPDLKQPSYQYGYQLSSVSNGISFPYILVQVNNNGPVAEEDVSKMAYDPAFTEKTFKDVQEKATNLISNHSVPTATYDEKRHLLTLKSTIQVPGGGSVSLIAAMFLTSKGMITFHCYSTELDTETPQRIFIPAIASVQLAESFVYRAPRLRGFNVPEFVIYGIVGGFAGLIFAGGRRLFSRKGSKLPSKT